MPDNRTCRRRGRRPLRRYVLRAVAVVACLFAAAPVDAAHGVPARGETVKYYVVQPSYQGRPERLWDIAARMLGAGGRAVEIYERNAGRPQPDGGRLTDPATLNPGWVLILPWDAVGPGVQVGPIPATPPAPVTRSPQPTPRTSSPPAPPRCADVPAERHGAPLWPQLRLAHVLAWQISRGAGTTVALLDAAAPVDSPALAGRVSGAVRLPSAEGRGGRDCASRETAMAGIIAAQPRPESAMVGMAPETTILPVVVDLTNDAVEPAELARAFTAAADAGADVVAVPVPVDLGAAVVRRSVEQAVRRDVVVVTPAAASGSPQPGIPGLLRVGAVGPDDDVVVGYPPDAVDVLAPGERVVTLAADGRGEAERSGGDVAVAYVAGLVALVRAADPQLPAVAAAQTVQSTADHGARQPVRGFGVINPAAAVEAVHARRPAGTTSAAGTAPAAGTAAPPRAAERSRAAVPAAVLGLAAATGTLWLWAARRRRA